MPSLSRDLVHAEAKGMTRKRVAVLISGRGSNMAALIEAAKEADYPAEIALVISNRPDAAGLARAKRAGIATAVIDHTAYGKHRIDLVCLAGFMRLLSPWLVERWQGRMLNIHPALLPAFKGLDTHRRALAAGAKVHGATVHLVVADLDSGPILAQEKVLVREDDTVETLSARVLEIEHRIYPQALKLLAQGRVQVVDGVVKPIV
jgi:phosphoribosylglycinamide formyltransferase-1